MVRTRLAGLLAVSLGTSLGLGATLYVDVRAAGGPPGDGSPELPFATIQEGLDAAVAGDEVVVADGTYSGVGNRDLDFRGKGVALHSANNDPTTCTIAPAQFGRGFFFHSGETGAATVRGFTIYYAFTSASGAGVYCSAASPTFNNCVITGCWAGAYGGGIYATGSASRPTLISCTLQANTANVGGGVYAESDSWITLTDCTIQKNVAGAGAGLYLRASPHTRLIRSSIVANSTTGSGAGLYCINGSSPLVTNCLFAGNTASGSGGGLFCSGSCSPAVVNCVFVGNIVGGDGGGIQCRSGSNPQIINCTFNENASDVGGGIACAGYSSPIVTNCILFINAAIPINISSGSNPVVTYCDIFGGYPGDGNVDVDPLYARWPSAGDDGQWGTADDDYGDLRLTAGSLCIDAGDNVNPPRDVLDLDADGCDTEPMSVDLDGLARYFDDPDTVDTGRGVAPLIDLGAYEYGAGAPVTGGPCAGDLNCDGVVDARDINPFVRYLTNYASWLASYPGCDPRNGDVNNDGNYGQWVLGDINPFVSILSGR
jgi:predicted outer membrane repeat protein